MVDHANPVSYSSQRNLWDAMRAGVRGRCPSCHEKSLYARYLKPADACNACGEELHHHRADDAPAYFSIFIIGHLIIPLILFIEVNYGWPLWVHAALWLPLALGLSLILLPLLKGAFIGLQCAFRMHGFGGDDGLNSLEQTDRELLAIHVANEPSKTIK